MSMMIAGCSHPTSGTSSAIVAHTTASATTGPAKPIATADDTTWGNYLAEQGKLHGKDVLGHPYIYVIPGGDSIAATTRRKNEAQSIPTAIGPIVIPGSLLVLGGPDPQQTNAFVVALPKAIKAGGLTGVVVLIVSDTTQKDAITRAYASTGATLRFAVM
ncbi:hypothetical protein [Rhodanobacter sp. C05]|uniref:hypothetical protein n=1 Tax=Rhodanobacter sp. C05 TaxID=1945855 RepID=UPI000985A62B|nr:hypothetical protein [Rhodanobacter sp. C05]